MPNIFKLMKRSKNAPACTAVIAAAGSSRRMGGGDKLFAELHGAPVLAYTLMAYQKCALIDEIIVVARADALTDVSALCEKYRITKAVKVIVGGETRLLSVLNGIYAVEEKAELVAIHDGARPCVDSATIIRAIEAAMRHHAAAPAIPVSSTVKRARDGIISETVDREGLYEMQTPQVFDKDLIKAALTNAKNKSVDVTDDCQAVEMLGCPVHITEGTRENIKITTSSDLRVAEAFLAERDGA
ncbi:MAG: 2-C-methyl-D-erythritol 4-phosphate cytidylyltransferase [Oscillospiraceae bacterium]|nr:2-C-methyl-D-erythritol 4-phosphate cytidylyltransferase [Oscillospiraceae bacterium]